MSVSIFLQALTDLWLAFSVLIDFVMILFGTICSWRSVERLSPMTLHVFLAWKAAAQMISSSKVQRERGFLTCAPPIFLAAKKGTWKRFKNWRITSECFLINELVLFMYSTEILSKERRLFFLQRGYKIMTLIRGVSASFVLHLCPHHLYLGWGLLHYLAD